MERTGIVTTIGEGTYPRFLGAITDLVAMPPSRDWFTRPTSTTLNHDYEFPAFSAAATKGVNYLS